MNRNLAEQYAVSENINQFLTFVLSGDVYGINILNIKEIIEYGCVARVPMMPSSIAGVINLRGSVVPVVDLAFRFLKNKSEITKKTSIVIVEIGADEKKMEVGVTVDIVNEVLDVSSDNIVPTPPFGTKIETDYISGMGKIGDEIITLLDIDAVLSIEQLSAIVED